MVRNDEVHLLGAVRGGTGMAAAALIAASFVLAGIAGCNHFIHADALKAVQPDAVTLAGHRSGT